MLLLSNVTRNITFVFHRIENLVEKGENACYFLFPQCFQKAFSSGCQSSMWDKGFHITLMLPKLTFERNSKPKFLFCTWAIHDTFL